MKKAKLMLTSLAVLAIVGGALAFKATKGTDVYCATTTGKTAGQTGCPLFSGSTYTTTTDNPASFYCTITNGNACDVAVSATAVHS